MFSQLFRLSTHSIIYGLGATASQLVGFFLIPLYTRYLTPADYGALAIFQVTVTVLSIVFVMGLGSALFRSYFSYEDEDSRKTVVSTAFLFLTATSGVLTLLLLAFAGSFSSLLFGSGDYVSYFRIVFLTVFCDAGSVIALSVLRAREVPGQYALIALARLVLSVSLKIAFVVALGRGVLGILEAGLIAAAFIYVVLTVAVVRKAGFKFSRDELKKMLSFGLPMVPAGLSLWIMTMSDRYFLQFLSTPDELGLYSLGYQFGLVIRALLVAPFLLAWMPFIFSVAKQANAAQTYSRVLTYFSLLAMSLALALSVLGKEVLAIMATPPFYDAYKVIPLIALSYVLFGCYHVLGVGTYLEAKTKYLAVFVVCAGVLNLGLNYLLIPDYGMMGAAGATVAAYLVLPVGSFLISRRFYSINYEWGRVIKILIAAGAIYAGSVFISHDSAYVAGVFKLLALLGFPILLYVLRFYRPDEIKKGKDLARFALGYVRRRLVG